MEKSAMPSLNPTEFTNELFNVLLKQFRESGAPDYMVMSLVLRYDNEWIGGAYGDEADGLIDIMELARVYLRCGMLDRAYSQNVTSHIEPTRTCNIPSRAINNIDYDRPATLADIGNVKVAFILSEIIQVPSNALSEADQMQRYGGIYPTTLDINIDGPQAAKIFFVPRIQLVAPEGAQEVKIDWAGRVMPGQTVAEGIADELKENFGYDGKFEWRNAYFRDWIKDKNGQDVQRFGLLVLLYPGESELI
jgi:hypothetical protein